VKPNAQISKETQQRLSRLCRHLRLLRADVAWFADASIPKRAGARSHFVDYDIRHGNLALAIGQELHNLSVEDPRVRENTYLQRHAFPLGEPFHG
jgi:hypothetical protein